MAIYEKLEKFFEFPTTLNDGILRFMVRSFSNFMFIAFKEFAD